MDFNLKTNQTYELLQTRPLDDIHSQGYYFLHKKSKAKVVIVANDDPNKVFYIGFRTPPNDSCGTPHIIEHSVLCGSEKFPVKDPFIELVKGSLNTFLNAMTYPDKTVYPVASCNDKDFQNLMDVYLDAVLHPNIYKEKNIFLQEGWRFELSDPEDDLCINGVVYNEMKGAFSSGESVLERSIQRSLYPDTPYCQESGGDPDVIPDLTYEQFLQFHSTYYHPSNSYIYLYGNMDIEEKLEWLDAAYLSSYDALALDSTIAKQPPLPAVHKETAFYAISSEESEENKTFLSYNWSIGTNLDVEQYVAFDILDYALLNSQGAPLKKALVDAGIGDDIYGGYEGGIYQPYFSVVAKNANPSDADDFCNTIFDVLKDQVENGINKTTLLAAINGAEFRFREADFGRYPKGLMYGLQLLDSWLYDDGAPFLHMDVLSIYASLREKLSTDYYETLVRRYLLDNTHASFLCVKPQKGLTAQKDAALQEALQQKKAAMSEDEIASLVAQTNALTAYQTAPSTKEELDTIPMLSREDMKKTSDPYSNHVETVSDVPILWHDYDTNGIVYLDYLFDVKHIREEEIGYLGVLKTLLGTLDTAQYSYVDLTNEIHLHTGGIHPEINVFAVIDENIPYEVKFELRMSTLEANLEKTLALATTMLLQTSFMDDKRIFDVLAQRKSRLQSELRSSGHSVAAGRALSYTSRSSRCNDLVHGIEQYRLLEQLVNDFDNQKEHLRATCTSLLQKLLQPAHLLVSVTCNPSALPAVKEQTAIFTKALYANEPSEKIVVSLPDTVNEGFLDASQIQYVALAGNFPTSRFPYTGALRVFRCIMNYEYLWQNIRVLGGAYGCSCNATRQGEIYFASYRDPNLQKTLDVYRQVAAYLEQFDADERDMTRYVIGTCSEMDAPLNPSALGRRSLLAYLNGSTVELLQKDRNEVLSVTVDDIKNLAPMLRAVIESEHICAIGNEENLKAQEQLFSKLEIL